MGAKVALDGHSPSPQTRVEWLNITHSKSGHDVLADDDERFEYAYEVVAGGRC
jgi:hypothetical protein